MMCSLHMSSTWSWNFDWPPPGSSWVTNSEELHRRIQEDETPLTDKENEPHNEEDQSYAKASLGVRSDEGPRITKVLGVQWQVSQDELHFDLGDVAESMESLGTNKKKSCQAKLILWPTGRCFPDHYIFKMFCQHICASKLGWDDPLSLSDQHQEKRSQLLSRAEPLRSHDVLISSLSPRLVGFCGWLSKRIRSCCVASLALQLFSDFL